MNISLPDGLQQFVLDQVTKGGYGSASEYIGELVRAEQAETSLEAEIINGLESGAATPMAPDDWVELRNRVRRHRQGR